MTPNIEWYLITAIILFFIGIYCLVVKRNAIRMVIGIEIITSAIHLNFIAIGVAVSPVGVVDPLAQTIVMASIVIGAAVATVALMLVIRIYDHYKTLDVKKLSKLRW